MGRPGSFNMGELECINALAMEIGYLILLANDFLEERCEPELSRKLGGGKWIKCKEIQTYPKHVQPRPFETPT